MMSCSLGLLPDSRLSKRNRVVWLIVVAITALVVAVEWPWVLTAREIVSYAQSYAQGHVQAYGWSQYDYITFVGVSYLSNLGPLLALGMLPLIAARLLTGWRWRY